jgi:glycerol kinase
MPRYLLALDQGTTGSTALIIDRSLQVVAKANREFPQIFPQPGWVSHDPEAIWQSCLDAIAAVLAQSGIQGSEIAGIGITNQRETTVVWQRSDGRPIADAIVWQCRRTAAVCDQLRADGLAPRVRELTGLPIDAYFSGTKVAWLLDNVAGARQRAEAGELAFGTIDSFLVHRLSGGAVHVTDPSNASRTMLYDIRRRAWSAELCEMLRVPQQMLPEVKPSAAIYATTRGVPGLPDGIPLAGMAGDQQAALCGQLCLDAGMAKCTYGTGAFLLMQTGSQRVESRHGLLTTVAWQVGDDYCYALEGAVFIAGAAVQWLRDGLGIIEKASEIEALAKQVPTSDGVVIVPALVGLGAPHWRHEARGLIAGLTRGTTRAHLARAALEGIALSCADLLDAMEKDLGRRLAELRVDGGAAANDLLMQIQADLLQCRVVRPQVIETTALGAAILAGVGIGWFSSLRDAQAAWRQDRTFEPGPESETQDLKRLWRIAVEKA